MFAVLVQPKSRTAHPGTTVKFSCEGQAEDGQSFLNINDDLLLGIRFENMEILQKYRDRGFSWEKHSENRQVMRWDVEILANSQNNNTRMVCYFEFKISDEVVVEATQLTVFEEGYIFTVDKEQGQCDELVFTVEAETDVGSSGISPNTTGGFPTCEKNINFLKQLWYVCILCTAIGQFMNVAELEIKLKKTENRKRPLLGIQFEVCMHANVLL